MSTIIPLVPFSLSFALSQAGICYNLYILQEEHQLEPEPEPEQDEDEEVEEDEDDEEDDDD